MTKELSKQLVEDWRVHSCVELRASKLKLKLERFGAFFFAENGGLRQKARAGQVETGDLL